MKTYSYALTVVALAMCQICTAQSLEPALASAPAPAAADLATGIHTSDEPRIIRGNDQVIAPAKTSPWLDSAPVTLNFEEAPIAEVVRTILGDILKTSYVLHPPLAGTVTLSTRAPVSPDQAVFLLESALYANGLALVRDARGSYHVGRPEALKGVGSSVRQVGKTPLQPGSGVIIVPLQYIGAPEMASILRPLLPPDGLVRVDTVRNLLVLSGTRTQAESWQDLIDTFDVDLLKGMSVGVFPLKYASVKEVENALQLMSGGVGAPAAPTTAGGARAPSGAAAAAPAAMLGEGNPLFGALRIMPIERINSILVVTPRAAYLDEARRWIERLDRPSDNAGESQLFIYQVQNVNARHLASVLSGIFGGQTSGSASASSGVAPGLNNATGASFGQSGSGSPFGSSAGFGSSNPFGASSSGLGIRAGGQTAGANNSAPAAPTATNLGGIRVMADELNNSVLIWSTKADYTKIESTLKRLDLPLTQVLIEATIVEVTLSDDLKYGLQWAFSDSPGSKGYTGQGQISGDQVTGGIFGGPTTQGFTYTLSNPLGKVRAVLSALATKSLINVISSPSLMVLDNHTATIKVGNQEPIRSSVTNTPTVNGTDRTSNIQYRDTGVNLVVTPSVNAGNIVTMQVDQTVTDLGPTKESADGQPTFLERQISSKVAVRSGETIVLGGLIKDSKKSGKAGVPYLHDIPVVGNLFGTTSNDDARTELLVVITPRVVRSDIDIRSVSEDLRDRMKGLPLFDAKDIAPPPMAPALLPLPPQ